MLLVPSLCTSRTTANLLTVSSHSHAPSGYAPFFSLKINVHLSLLLYSYTIWLNINYSVITEVDAMIKLENDSDDIQECCLTQQGQMEVILRL